MKRRLASVFAIAVMNSASALAGWAPIGGGYGYRPAAYGGPLVGSIPDALGITGASSSDIGVGLGFYTGSRYEGY